MSKEFVEEFKNVITNNIMLMLFLSEKNLSLEFHDWSKNKTKDLDNMFSIIKEEMPDEL